MRGNFKGLICPKFAVIWGALSAIFYFLVFPLMGNFLVWFNEHLQFGFFGGVFYGIFAIDLIISSGAAVKIRSYARKNNVIVSQHDTDAAKKRTESFGMGFADFVFNSRVGEKKKDEE